MSTLSSTVRTSPHSQAARQGGGWWGIVAVALVCLAFGLPILVGGVYLAWLGGSLYYAPAGFGLVLTGILLLCLSLNAVWVYLLTYAGTVVWAFWEAGFDWWAQVPRLVAPTVVLLLVLLVLPALLNRDPRYH